MKKIKFIGLFAIFLLTGCGAKYHLVIEDNNVMENLNITFENSVIDGDIENYIEDTISQYQSSEMFKNYKFYKNIGNVTSSVSLKTGYKTLEDFSSSPLLKDVFEDLQILKNDEYTILKTIGEYNYYEIFGNEESPQIYFDEVTIEFRMHNVVLESNADSINEEENVYTWKLTRDQKEKYLYIKYSPKKRYDIIIKDWFSNNYKLLIVSILFFLLISCGIFYIKKVQKKINEI